MLKRSTTFQKLKLTLDLGSNQKLQLNKNQTEMSLLLSKLLKQIVTPARHFVRSVPGEETKMIDYTKRML